MRVTQQSRRRDNAQVETGAAKLLYIATPVAMMLVIFVLTQSATMSGHREEQTHFITGEREDEGDGTDPSALESLKHVHDSSLQNNGMVHFSERDDPVRTRELRRAYPVFIHVPKTGGTAVENIMRKEYDVKVGRFAFKPLPDDKAGAEKGRYEIKAVPCSPWHSPPKSFVPESFVIVRNPYARVVSEFCYIFSLHDSGWFVKKKSPSYESIFGNKTWVEAMKAGKETRETREKMCNYFSIFMVPALREAAERSSEKGKAMYTEGDCHLLPQSLYFTKAEWVIEQYSLEKVHELLAMYGLERFAAEEKAFNKIPTDHANASSQRCAAYAFDCITDEVASLVETLDGKTFEYFGYSRDWRSLRPELSDAE